MKAWVKIIVLFSILLCPLLFFTVNGQNYTIKQQRDAKDTTRLKNILVFSTEKQKLINKVLPEVEFYYFKYKRKAFYDGLSILWAEYNGNKYKPHEQFNELLTDIDINKKNYALFSSNKITDENYAHNRESNNIGTNSLIAQYYDNCRKVDTFKMIPKEDTKKIFKKISKVTPIGIYDSIYRINQSEIINHHLEPQSRQISEVDLERSNTN